MPDRHEAGGCAINVGPGRWHLSRGQAGLRGVGATASELDRQIVIYLYMTQIVCGV